MTPPGPAFWLRRPGRASSPPTAIRPQWPGCAHRPPICALVAVARLGSRRRCQPRRSSACAPPHEGAVAWRCRRSCVPRCGSPRRREDRPSPPYFPLETITLFHLFHLEKSGRRNLRKNPDYASPIDPRHPRCFPGTNYPFSSFPLFHLFHLVKSSRRIL